MKKKLKLIAGALDAGVEGGKTGCIDAVMHVCLVLWGLKLGSFVMKKFVKEEE